MMLIYVCTKWKLQHKIGMVLLENLHKLRILVFKESSDN